MLKIEKISVLLISILIVGCTASPGGLKFEKNLMKGLEISKDVDKPMFIHFTGWGTGGSNEFMDDLVTSKKIQNKLNEEFVTVQLYTDDRHEIEISDTLNLHKFELSEQGKSRLQKARTIGQINIAIQIGWIESNAQPQYLITDSNGNILVEPFGYTGRNKTLFNSKLDEGLEKYKMKK